MRVSLDRRSRRLGAHRLLAPTGRLLRLGPDGPAALEQAVAGSTDPRVVALARRLVEAGAAHPVVEPRSALDVTVVIPVKDRLEALARCLAAVDHDDVLVVDDGSQDAAAVARLCARHGARVVHRANGGPAAARNTALPLLHKDFVAFLDSDCVPPAGWLARLRAHFDDAQVAAVAPRVQGGPRSPLDLGPDPAAVRPGGRVGYVPTAALLVRRRALTPFDETLRYGEDVDLIWRLVEQGWAVRYDPAVVVAHTEPSRLTDRLVRRFHYGTSAAPLGARHPDALTHLVLPPWPTAVLALLLIRRPLAASAVAAFATGRLDRTVDDLPTSARLVAGATVSTGLGLGRALALAGPLAWTAALRRPALAALLVAPALQEWAQRRPAEDPLRYAARALGDQAAYGVGVAVGCARHGTARPLLPRRTGPAETGRRRTSGE